MTIQASHFLTVPTKFCVSNYFSPITFNFQQWKNTLFFSIILSILAERNRVPLQFVNGVENSDYINAVFVQVRIFHWHLFGEDFPARPAVTEIVSSTGMFVKPIQHNSIPHWLTLFILNSLASFSSFKLFSQNVQWGSTSMYLVDSYERYSRGGWCFLPNLIGCSTADILAKMVSRFVPVTNK